MYFKIFCPKQGQGFKRSATYLYPNSGRVLPPPTPPSPTRGFRPKQHGLFQAYCYKNVDQQFIRLNGLVLSLIHFPLFFTSSR